MTLRDPPGQKTFKNTFAPQMENGELGVHDVIIGLRSAVLSFESLPRKVRDAVEVELGRLAKIKETRHDGNGLKKDAII